jgi:hypothetical protein
MFQRVQEESTKVNQPIQKFQRDGKQRGHQENGQIPRLFGRGVGEDLLVGSSNQLDHHRRSNRDVQRNTRRVVTYI